MVNGIYENNSKTKQKIAENNEENIRKINDLSDEVNGVINGTISGITDTYTKWQ